MPKKPAVINVHEKNKKRRKTLTELFDKLAQRYGRHTAWSDWIYMCAASISQVMDFKQGREDKYLHLINSYDKEYHNVFPEMFGELTFAFEEEGFGDILGDIYSSMRMTNDKNGQVFTPYHISKFMAALNGDADSLAAEIERRGYITVSDPCCGAGVMLISFADHCKDCDINYQESVLFAAQDIDPVAALMCYVQMSLLGMPGYVIIGNALSGQAPEADSTWYTPMYFWQGFHYRTQTDIPEETEDTAITTEIVRQPETQKIIIPAAKIDVVLRETDSGQFAFDFAS